MYYYDYSFGNIETISTHAEWTSMMREEAMGMSNTSDTTSEPTAKTGVVTLVVVATTLFLVSVGTLAFGTVKVVEGLNSLHQPLVPMQTSAYQHLQ
jgi:hypothetical protein